MVLLIICQFIYILNSPYLFYLINYFFYFITESDGPHGQDNPAAKYETPV